MGSRRWSWVSSGLWRLSGLLAIAALVWGPFAAAAHAGGLGNDPPTVTGLTASPSSTLPGTEVFVLATASDPDTSGKITRFSFTAPDGGLFQNASTTLEIVVNPAATTSSVAVSWSAPSPGNYTLTCVAWDNGGFLPVPLGSAPRSVLVTVQDPQTAAPKPVISALVATPPTVLVGQTSEIHVTARSDPPGGPLTYAWSATAGSIAGSGASATWTAPTQPGVRTIIVLVRDAAGEEASATVGIGVVGVRGFPPLKWEGLVFPDRVAADPAGNLYVSDRKAGVIHVVTPQGQPLRTIPIDGLPGGVAVSPNGTVYAGDLKRGRVEVIPPIGPRQALGRGDGEFSTPFDVAVDTATGRIFVADGRSEAVKVYDPQSLQRTMTISLAGGQPTGVAIAPNTQRVYVADARRSEVRVYDAQGSQVQTIGGQGSGAGELTRPAGLALSVAQDRLFVVDTYQARVSVFTTGGAFVGTLGSAGTEQGQLRIPIDAVVGPFERLVVSNADNARLELFRLTGAQTPSRSGDTDLDGMPDWWEIAHGLDPEDARDAYLDADGDGLPNLQEYAYGTDPRMGDTDADGIGDLQEIESGQDPLDPSDNRAIADAGGDVTAGPSLVALDGGGSNDPNGDPLSYEWRQAAGPSALVIHDADTVSPRLVARAAGEYRVELRVSDGKAWSPASEVRVTILDVPPTADPGPPTGALAGEPVRLDGRFSSDSNGDGLTYAWRQVEGPPVALSAADSARPVFTATSTGVYGFDLVVEAGSVQSATGSVHVLVDAPGDHLPVAVAAAPLSASVGSPVTLDGSRSLDTDLDTLSYAWLQTDGPPVTLAAADNAVASFTPTAPGLYRFALTVGDGTHQSLPHVATVAVDSAQNVPPLADAGFDQRVRILDPVTLNGAGSFDRDGHPIAFAWRQVEGTRVPLVTAGATAAFVPLVAGTYRFELEVGDSFGPGTRDVVTVIADDPGRSSVPLAIAPAIGTGRTGEPLILDGTRSYDLDPGTTLGFTWTQIAGPRAILSYPHASAPSFTPALDGAYAFELRVDDGVTRSAPARLDVTVSASAPVARAGGDLLAVAGAPRVLDGHRSTAAPGRRLSFRWQQVGGPLDAIVAGADTQTLSVTAPRPGTTLRFRLVVNDGLLDSAPDEVEVNVVDAPLALRTLDAEGGTVRVTGRSSPFDGLSLEVPEGALAQAVTFALGEVADTGFAPPGEVALHRALFLGPLSAQLLSPLSLAIPLDARALAESGAEPSQVRVSRYDHHAEVWVAVDDAALDSDGTTLLIAAYEPGTFLLTVPEPIVVAGGGGGCHFTAASGPSALSAFAILALLVGALALARIRRRRPCGAVVRSGEGRS